MNLQRITFAEESSLRDIVFDEIKAHAWPEFMFHDDVANRLWHHLADDFADFQFVLKDGDELVAVGQSIPFVWDREEELPDDGWDGIFKRAVADNEARRAPNMVSALEAAIHPKWQGKGVSKRVIEAMRDIALAHGLKTLVAPVRPSEKAKYPLTLMERYVEWTNDKGEPFDAWIRTHWRLGGRIVKVAPRSMLIEGSVAEWEKWTGMAFPDSGGYVVSGALTPITIDRERDCGRYVEPNVWMEHQLTSA